MRRTRSRAAQAPSPRQRLGPSHGSTSTGSADAAKAPPIPAQVHDWFGNAWLTDTLAGEDNGPGTVVRSSLMESLAGLEPPDHSPLQSNQAMLRAMASAGPVEGISLRPGVGEALPEPIRERMERAFGHSFSHVRVHRDAQAASDARALNARAFTTGADIYFASGAWAPGSPGGDRLLAHELTHVVQHDAGQLDGAEGVSNPTDPSELAAYRNEDRILDRLTGLDADAPSAELPARNTPAPETGPILRQAEDEDKKRAAREKIEAVMELCLQGDWDVDTEAAKLTDTEMGYLTHKERVALIEEIARGHLVMNEDERTLLRLITTTSDPKALLVDLQRDDAELLRTLVSSLDFTEHTQLHGLLRGLTFASMDPQEALDQMEQAKVFPWADPGIIRSLYHVRFAYNVCELTEEGKIHIQYWVMWGNFGDPRPTEYLLDPFELVRVDFLLPEDHVKAEEGQSIYMPAVNLYDLHRKQFKQALGNAADVALLFVGIGGLAAISKLRRVVAMVEIAFSAADITVREFRSEIAKTEGGAEFLETWGQVQTLMMVYGGARILLELPSLVMRAKARWTGVMTQGGADLNPKLLERMEPHLDELNLASQRAEALSGLSEEAKGMLAACDEQELKQIADQLIKNPDDAAGILEQLRIKQKKQPMNTAPSGGGIKISQKLDNSIDEVMKVRSRGFPYGFKDKSAFNSFKKTIHQELDAFKLPKQEVAIQGSAVHNPSPKDIDVAVLVDEATFQELGARFKSWTSKDRIKELIDEDMLGGKIKSFLFDRPGDPGISFAQKVRGAAGALDIQVSIVLKGGPFDVGPYLKF